MSQLTEQQTEFLRRYMGFRPTGKIPISAEENDRLERLTPEELVAADLTRCDTKKLFGDEYMIALKDVTFKGEGSPDLKALMREVVKGLSGQRRIEVMEELSVIVGLPPTAEDLDRDYGRFLVVRKQQKVNGVTKDEDAPDLDEERHADFMASRGQLMFGKVLGDAFGIHEVFAALLSPTGGLVGPGNSFIPGSDLIDAFHLDPDNPVALHGCVHDAAGYLHTFHDTGPGYNYLDSSLELFPTDSPLSGQFSGIAYWVEKAGDDYTERRTDAAVLAVEKGLESARNAVADSINGLLKGLRSKSKQAVETVKGAIYGVADAIQDAVSKVKETAVEPHKPPTADPSIPASTEVKGKLEALSKFLWS
ncbi:MAG: hypothetical protein AB3N21_19455 [Ruegeria sp.]|uniref:hypothetical protein n=1 Tax=Ruegeria sp. TaxID=1879320 RepID=UPI00349E4B3F